jgi:hypothetical protein
MTDAASLKSRNEIRPSRPSLYSVGHDAGTEASASILGGLETKRPWKRGTYIGMGIAAIVLVGVFNLSGRQGWGLQQPRPAEPQVHASPPVQQQAANAPDTSQSDEVRTAHAPVNQAAVELESQTAHLAALASDVSPPLADAEQAPHARAALADPRAVEAVPTPVAGGLALLKSEVLRDPGIQKPIAAKRGIQEQKPKAAAAKNPAPARDQDVELIAALLARIAADERRTPAQRAKQPVNKAANTAGNTPEAKRGKGSELTRDIVFKSGRDSTEVLVERCRSLGFFEGEWCRLRICEGRWGSDPACPGTQVMVGAP